MPQNDFYSKSKEELSTIALAFQMVTKEQADSMSKEELAGLLSREQARAGAKEEAAQAEPKEAKAAPKKAAKDPAKTPKKAAAKVKAPKEAVPEVKEEAPKTEETVAKEATTAKRGRKKPEAVSADAETAVADVTPIEALIEQKEAPKAEAKNARGRKPKNKETAESPKSSEPAEEPKTEEVKQEESSEKPVKDQKKKSRNKNKGEKAEAKATEQTSEQPKEQAQETKPETASEETVSEQKDVATDEQKKPEETSSEKRNNNAHGKKNKKGRHRSIEIRPSGEGQPAEGEHASSDENGAAEGENGAENANPENNKPQIEPIEFVGVLEIVSEGGYGFVRRENYLPSPQDVFVPTNLIRRFGLRMGDQIRGFALPKRGQDKNLALSYITTVNDVEVEKLGKRPHFERLTPIYPDEKFKLETGKQELSTRIIDLVSPIGKGQRGMIVSPPKAGKTILLQKVANAITQNSPKTKLIVLLIDERPEEVTDMQRSISGEVVYSTFDKKPENHTRVTELVLERAMRLVEMGEDVVILLDSMTRLARAYNLTITPTGRTLSGGLDPGSLYGPKRFFGAARNIENGGSLTIVATSLIETGSRMDEVIFEEFKGTGNMEVYLDRKLSEKRIFPAIDINKSGTRREDLLMTQEELDAVWTIRKAFSQMETAPVTETIINLLLRTNSNDHFVRSVKVSFADKEVFDAMRGNGSQSNGKE